MELSDDDLLFLYFAARRRRLTYWMEARRRRLLAICILLPLLAWCFYQMHQQQQQHQQQQVPPPPPPPQLQLQQLHHDDEEEEKEEADEHDAPRPRPYKKQRLSDAHVRLHMLDGRESYIQRTLRCEPGTFELLLRELALPERRPRKGVRGGGGGANSLPPRERLAIALTYWATGCTFFHIAQQYAVSEQTVANYVKEVGEAILQRLHPRYVPFPSHAQQLENALHVERSSGIPGVVAAIDGCHLSVHPPGNFAQAGNFYNYKRFFSMILLTAADHDMKFVFTYFGMPGRNNDSTALKESPLYARLEDDYGLGVNHDNQLHPLIHHGILLGDSGFPLKPWLMVPFADADIDKARRQRAYERADIMSVFNKRLSSSRMVIEQAFGLLKLRWRILQRDQFRRPLGEFGPTVDVCVTLHNFLLTHQGLHYRVSEDEKERAVALFQHEQELIRQALAAGGALPVAAFRSEDDRRRTAAEKRWTMAHRLYSDQTFGNSISIPIRNCLSAPRRARAAPAHNPGL